MKEPVKKETEEVTELEFDDLELFEDDELLPVVDDLSPPDVVEEVLPITEDELADSEEEAFLEVDFTEESSMLFDPEGLESDGLEELSGDEVLDEELLAQEPVQAEVPLEADEESLTLPDSDLDEILLSSDAALFEDMPEDGSHQVQQQVEEAAIPETPWEEPVQEEEDPVTGSAEEELDYDFIDDMPLPDELTEEVGDTLLESPPPAPSEEFPVDEEETDGPVALSEDELENILSDVAGDAIEETGLEVPEEPIAPALTEEGVGDFADVSFTEEDVAEPSLAESDDLDPLAEDETVFIFDEDDSLDGISGDLPADLDVTAEDVEAAARSDAPDALQEDDITLSEEELDMVLMETDETEPSEDMPGEDLSGEEVPADITLDSLGDEEDESITLTLEELGNIVSDVRTEEASGEQEEVPFREVEPTFEQEDVSFGEEELSFEQEEMSFGEEELSFEQEEMSFNEEETPLDQEGMSLGGEEPLAEQLDDGPVALSDSELDSIMEDVSEYDDAPVGAEHADVAESDADYDEDVFDLDEAPPFDEADAFAGVPPPEMAADEMPSVDVEGVPREELKKMISYLDHLFDKLPHETVREFSKSEYFDLYKKIMSELGLS